MSPAPAGARRRPATKITHEHGALLAPHVLSSLRLHQPLCGKLRADHLMCTCNQSPGCTHPTFQDHMQTRLSQPEGGISMDAVPALHTLYTLLTSTQRAAAVMLRSFSMPLPVVQSSFTDSWLHTTDLPPLLRTGHAKELRSLARHACRKLASLVGRSAVWLGQSVDMARQVCGPYLCCPTSPFVRFSLRRGHKSSGDL